MCFSSNRITLKCTWTKQEDRHQCLLDWNEVDNLCREPASIFVINVVSLCVRACTCAVVNVMEATDWQNHDWHHTQRKTRAPLTDNSRAECVWSVEGMQSRVCRSGIKWVEHAATPGPRLKSRLAEQQQQKIQNSLHAYLKFMWPLPRRVFICLCCVLGSSPHMRCGGKNHNTAKSFYVWCTIPSVVSFVCAKCNKTGRCVRSRRCMRQ